MMHLVFVVSTIVFISVQSTDYELLIDANHVMMTKPTPFYGFTIDWWTADDPRYGKQWRNAGALTVDFSNENFIALVAAVSPSFLRIGGSPEDSIIYNISGECLDINASLPGYHCSQTKNNYGCMSMMRWKQINEFAIKTNATLLFGLNGCYGRPASNESMDFSNIAALFKATVDDMDSHSNLYGFELANELDSSIDAKTYATDFITVYKMIQSTFTDTSGPVPYLVGADVGPLSYSQAVMESIQQQTNNADVSAIMHSVTYHHYPQCMYPGNETVYDMECLSNIHESASAFANMASAGMTMSWMGEGSGHSGGGIYNVSDTFVDCFYYLYQLCTVLSNGVRGTMRSDLIGGDYELIDKETFLPNPSYWILYLFKRFVGNTLHAAFDDTYSNAKAFAFNGAGSHGTYQVVLVLINFDLNNKVVVQIDVMNGAKEYKSEEYHLKSTTELNSKVMMVNDVPMQYANAQFPQIHPVLGNADSVTLDAATIAFVVLTPQ